MSGFYVGYLPKAPEDVAGFVRRIVLLLLSSSAILAAVLVIAQERFSPAVFEWQTVREFRGIIEERPYPTLLVERPGQTQDSERYSRYLLVGVGKRGASQDVAGFEGKSVRLRGKLIYRAENTMIEAMPGSIVPQASSDYIEELTGGEVVTVRGEIVDSKCFSGVMNPGKGKIHRDCAVRCLSGGVPPVLLADGGTQLYILTDRGGQVLPTSSFLDRVAEPVTVTGQLFHRGDSLELHVTSITRD